MPIPWAFAREPYDMPKVHDGAPIWRPRPGRPSRLSHSKGGTVSTIRGRDDVRARPEQPVTPFQPSPSAANSLYPIKSLGVFEQ